MTFSLNQIWIGLIVLCSIELVYLIRKSGRSEAINYQEIFTSVFYSFLIFNVVNELVPDTHHIFNHLYENYRLSPLWEKNFAYWCSLVALHEVFYYFYHRCTHKFSYLWILHGSHHSSNQMTFFAGMRGISVGAFSLYWLFFMPLVVVGFRTFDILWIYALTKMYQIPLHAKWMPHLGVLESFLMTPKNHLRHHLILEDGKAYNFGGFFVLMDRVFGTYSGKDAENPKYGIWGVAASKQNLLTPILDPLFSVAHRWRLRPRQHRLVARASRQ